MDEGEHTPRADGGIDPDDGDESDHSSDSEDSSPSRSSTPDADGFAVKGSETDESEDGVPEAEVPEAEDPEAEDPDIEDFDPDAPTETGGDGSTEADPDALPETGADTSAEVESDPDTALDVEDGTSHDTPDVESIESDADTLSLSTDARPETAGIDNGGRDRSSPDVDFDGVVLDDDEDNQGLFDDLLSGEPIFENKEVLRPSYTPHELPHRNDQINRMATILVSALRGETPSNILIYGKTGTGKTASAKFVSQELESTSQKYDVPCEVEYINCEVTDTQYRVLAQLANTFIEENQAVIADRLERLEALREDATDAEDTAGRDAAAALADTEFDSVAELDDRIETLEDDADEMEEVPMTGWPTDRVYSTFFEAVDYHERVVVIMLDEIDKLVEKSGDDTLYNLSRMNSELDRSRISIMGISNDLKFTDFLDPRVKSSLGEEEIVFPPYDANQLRDILQHRADTAFKPDALTDDVIPLCAAFAAQEHGDARRALDLLRTAGELAERSQAEIVAEKHVRQAQDKIELDRVVEVVRTLPTQSKIVLFAVILLEKNGVHNINTGEVFNIYKRLCEEIDADVLTQRRVTDLISELDMLGIVNAVVVSKGRYGRTKEMGLSVPVEETEAVLLSDSRLGDIENAQPFVQARFDN
ncbi:orc1/cdc6 family replication initiation protein [Halorubrum distributum JCM 9100]|uniref:ORC1-type DNA replication protein n=2 Tax=Halorubrum distributum TaxID=29283 RepID=M0EEW4_9EURY|nr:orc1/cdc6 family replication initiation protein [Halorubrum distributum]ELZ44949.1 orc1/cdc6 family replication initiation protein [Halorubrum distributum JCM 9100]ELZ51067.1 orc1/cdc6 family replication initiation protein [Halorubrum distributum JCM 10118]